jgi:hypothetical protein
MIPARISDDAASAFFICERRDFVVRAAEFECANGLQIFRLQIELPVVPFEGNQRSADGDPIQPGPGFANVIE